MLKDFRDFVLRGNVVDLAVAVVLGATFGAVVTAFVTSFITPLIALIGGQPDFNGLAFDVAGTEFPYGRFVTALISFLIVAAVVFFFVIKPLNVLTARLLPAPPVDRPTRECPDCLSSVPAPATRCSFCTSSLTPPGA